MLMSDGLDGKDRGKTSLGSSHWSTQDLCDCRVGSVTVKKLLGTDNTRV